MGLLDRLSYKTRDKIPRNWKETTIDPLKITDASRQIELPVQHVPDNHQPRSNDNRTSNITSEESTSQDVQRNKRGGQDPITPPKKRYVERPSCTWLGSVRINKKPPRGNNRYGRKGTLTCILCRSRSQKVYTALPGFKAAAERDSVFTLLRMSHAPYVKNADWMDALKFSGTHIQIFLPMNITVFCDKFPVALGNFWIHRSLFKTLLHLKSTICRIYLHYSHGTPRLVRSRRLSLCQLRWHCVPLIYRLQSFERICCFGSNMLPWGWTIFWMAANAFITCRTSSGEA